MATTNNVPSNIMSHAVFNVVELLESIILYLPMRDMQRSRRVSRQWRETVDGSLPIRKALFLEPGTVKDLAIDAEIIDPYLHALDRESITLCHHSTHPLFDPRYKASANRKPGNCHQLAASATLLRDVYLVQPPTTTDMSAILLYSNVSLDTMPIEIKLEAGETFGSLHGVIARALDDHRLDANFTQWCWTQYRDYCMWD
ncbi:hypothetical protein LTR97_003904 [Elasticomyces elasticus]|uniref:F-box domain-containing protein n=1 Tax=Elasticomyces elasticus TaxID=574655 RepID=A0AAN7WD62_9PEZI|nr:hypothetical protein LTR97_003904 [Elasticomyces elasticus]